MSTPSAPATVKVNLPPGILRNAQTEAARIGISLQDFIRMLMATYFANARAIRLMPRDQALFDRAQREIREGAYTEVGSTQALNEYLDSLTF